MLVVCHISLWCYWLYFTEKAILFATNSLSVAEGKPAKWLSFVWNENQPSKNKNFQTQDPLAPWLGIDSIYL